jgi:hypothetical protein
VEYNKQRLHKVSYIFVPFRDFLTPNDDSFHTIAVLVCGVFSQLGEDFPQSFHLTFLSPRAAKSCFRKRAGC